MDANDKIAIFLVALLWVPLFILVYITLLGLLGGPPHVIPFEILTEICLGVLGSILTSRAWRSFRKKYGRK